MWEETYLKTLEETDAYRVDSVDVESFGGKTRMFKLTLKVDGKEIFVQRCHYDFELPDLIRRIDNSRGFYCNYGKGYPLDEFADRLRLFVETPRGRKPFTIIDDYGGVFVFVGNHEEYSGAFRYLIWDKRLAGKVRRKLEKITGG